MSRKQKPLKLIIFAIVVIGIIYAIRTIGQDFVMSFEDIDFEEH